MTTLVNLVSEYYIWLIGACVLGILFYIGRAIAAHREKSRAIFTLEREAAASSRLRSIIMVFVVSALAGVVYFTATYLEPNLYIPAENEATPTVLLQPTPTPTPGTPTATPTPRPTLTPRPTQTPETKTTPTPTPEPVILPNCPIDGARLTYPTVNAVLKGPVEVSGSANIDNFDYYKFEFRPEGVLEWSFVQSFREPVDDGFLGVWDTSTLPAGKYRFRLVVVKKDGNYPGPCEVQVTIEH
ncbi:MAG: hypothetical protein WBW48_17610 [Anaerolineae bacterium]